MGISEFLEIINDLNEQLIGNKWIENRGLYFCYKTDGYYDVIVFGEFCVYCSEYDSLYEFDEDDNEIELSIKDVVIKNFNEYVKTLKTVKLK